MFYPIFSFVTIIVPNNKLCMSELSRNILCMLSPCTPYTLHWRTLIKLKRKSSLFPQFSHYSSERYILQNIDVNCKNVIISGIIYIIAQFYIMIHTIIFIFFLQALGFLLVGNETISTALCLTSYAIAAHSDVQDQLHQEIDQLVPTDSSTTYDIVMKMGYLDMVIKESLRMYPPTVVWELLWI